MVYARLGTHDMLCLCGGVYDSWTSSFSCPHLFTHRMPSVGWGEEVGRGCPPGGWFLAQSVKQKWSKKVGSKIIEFAAEGFSLIILKIWPICFQKTAEHDSQRNDFSFRLTLERPFLTLLNNFGLKPCHLRFALILGPKRWVLRLTSASLSRRRCKWGLPV